MMGKLGRTTVIAFTTVNSNERIMGTTHISFRLGCFPLWNSHNNTYLNISDPIVSENLQKLQAKSFTPSKTPTIDRLENSGLS